MKRIALIVIKLLLVILFLQNIGFFSFISNIEDKPQPPQKADGGRGDLQYLNEKIERAKKLGTNYGPEEYFADLTDIRLKEKANEFDRMAATHVFYTTNTLMTSFHNNVMEHRRSDSSEKYSAFMEELSIAQKKHLSIADPEQEKESRELTRKMNQPGYWLSILVSFLTWLAGFYLKNLPLGFVLLWAWWYEEKERLSINNPLSFLICVLLYPVVIIRVWRRSLRYGARMFAMNIEFKRRQTDIFAMISNNELEDIKRFARSDFKLRDYQRYLENRSLIVRHSLVPVGIVALTLLLTPKVYSSVDNHSTINTTEYQMPIKAPPNLMPDDFSSHHDLIMVAITPEETKIFFIPLIWQFNLPPVLKYVGGFKTNPDPVPVCC